jgi:hypothetical protein
MELKLVAVYPSDFGQRLEGARSKLPKRVRRMSRRKVKRWLEKQLQQVWDAAAIRQSS